MIQAASPHARLRELVTPFADGELPRVERRQVEAHLGTCRECRNELALQRTLSRALAEEPMPGASSGLRRRIEWMGEPDLEPERSPRSRIWTGPATAALIVFAALAGALLIGRRSEAARSLGQIPMLRDALADCRRATAHNFPRAADLRALSQDLEFKVRALEGPGLELFSTWKTTLAGSPAAGLAYRWRGIVLVQYAVPAELVQRQLLLRESPGRAGFYSASEWGQGVIAVLQEGVGTLLVAEAPTEELRRLVL